MKIRFLKSIEGTVALSVFIFSALIIGMVSCAEDAVTISLNVAYDTSAQTVVSDAEAAGDPLSVRFLYTYPSRIVAGNQVVSVRPTTAIPVGGLDNPAWETSQAAGFDIASATLSMDGVPLGNNSTEMYVELLRPGRLGQWYAVAYGCIREFSGLPLTKDRLKSLNGSTITLSKGRTCGGCNPPKTYTDYDDDTCN